MPDTVPTPKAKYLKNPRIDRFEITEMVTPSLRRLGVASGAVIIFPQ